MNIKPSTEQKAIIESVKKGNNVLCDAVAGSGKTSTVLSLSKACPKKTIIQITYNKQLKLEVRQKVRQCQLTNITIDSYHSLAVRYYDENAYDDQKLQLLINKKKKPRTELPSCDILVIDEAQDMTLLYYHFVAKFIRDLAKKPKMLILGDKYQGVYKFKSADIRFLTLGHKIWKMKRYEQLSMNTSYRVTKPIAHWVNDIMLGENRLIATKPGYKVKYICGNITEMHDKIVPYILTMLRNKTAKEDDIFVLAPSIKSALSPVKRLENALVLCGVNCFVPSSDDSKIDDSIIKGKVVFTTFHQAKGRERKNVIIYNFDNSYFEYFNKTASPEICPPELYVGATRASERLFLIHDSKCEPLPFLKKKMRELIKYKYVDYYCFGEMKLKDCKIEQDDYHKTSPTELVKFIKDDIIELIYPTVETLYEIENEATKKIKIPSKIKSKNGKYEEISDINGLIIPSIYEENNTGSNTVLNYINKSLSDDKYLRRAIVRIPTKNLEIKDYLYAANVYTGIRNQIYHKLAQIDDYNWLNCDMIKACHNNMNKFLGQKNYAYEIETNYKYRHADFGGIDIKGIMDAVGRKIVWEFKCVDSITIEHLLQLIIYAWMWYKDRRGYETYGSREFKIMNIRTGEVRKLRIQMNLIEDIMSLIFQNKYGRNEELSDEKFIKKCIGVYNKLDQRK